MTKPDRQQVTALLWIAVVLLAFFSGRTGSAWFNVPMVFLTAWAINRTMGR